MRNSLNASLILLSFAALAVASIAPASAEGIRLKRSFVENEITKYKVETTGTHVIVSPLLGDQEIQEKGVFSLDIKTLTVTQEAKGYNIQADSLVQTYEKTGPMAQMVPGPKVGDRRTQQGTLDSFNNLTIAKEAKTNLLAYGLEDASTIGLIITFPDRDLKVGDSWDVVLPPNPAVKVSESQYRATLQSERTIDGVDVVLVSLIGKAKSTVDMAKAFANGGEATAALPPLEKALMMVEVDLKADLVIEKATGKTRSVTATIASKEVTELQLKGDPTSPATKGQDISIPSTSTAKFTVTLVK